MDVDQLAFATQVTTDAHHRPARANPSNESICAYAKQLQLPFQFRSRLQLMSLEVGWILKLPRKKTIVVRFCEFLRHAYGTNETVLLMRHGDNCGSEGTSQLNALATLSYDGVGLPSPYGH